MKKEVKSEQLIYICEAQGNDQVGTGSEKMPFQTLSKAISTKGGKTEEFEFMSRKAILESYEPVAKTRLKKEVKV